MFSFLDSLSFWWQITHDWWDEEESLAFLFISILSAEFGLAGTFPEIFDVCSGCCLWTYSLSLTQKHLDLCRLALLRVTNYNHSTLNEHECSSDLLHTIAWKQYKLWFLSKQHTLVHIWSTYITGCERYCLTPKLQRHSRGFNYSTIMGRILQVWIYLFWWVGWDLSFLIMFAFSSLLQLFVLSESVDDLYIEGLPSGDSPLDDEGGDDNDGSGSGSGDYCKNKLGFFSCCCLCL